MLRLALLMGVLFAVPASAAPLNPEQAQKGWIMLFDGESSYGWKVEGDATVKEGKLIVGGEKESKITSTTEFDAFELVIDFDTVDTAEIRAGTAVRKVTPFSRARHTANFRVTSRGATRTLEFSLTDQKATALDSEGLGEQTGRHPIVITVPAGKKITVSRIWLLPNDLKSIFNGKDLTGWKIFPDRKSKFVVTPEGAINVKDGPGDLQTIDQYGDFILQFECISNGEFLNSGIFFRGIPNEYQQGYEAQIRNQWVGEDRNKPVDFGTGAIYRRQPARKVVSNDKEWFTMTLITHGNHMATWVNGYQVADFFDDRPEADNARKGLKLGKGVISIQGHDPTTDLSFRNLKIVELPKK